METILSYLLLSLIPIGVMWAYSHSKDQRKKDAEDLSKRVHKAIDDIMEDGVVEMPKGKLKKRRWGARLRERDAATHRPAPRELVSTNLTKDRTKK